MDIVYFHGSCPDGWCAAYVAHKKYPEAQLVPLSYGGFMLDELIEQVRGKDVLMADFALKSIEDNDALNHFAKSFHIYDHHKTALQILKDAPYATLDMERSGAGLTWDYLFGEDSPEACYDQGTSWSPRPWWVDYTEDQDLWRFKLPQSRAVNAWLNVQPRTFTHWDIITNSEGGATNAVRMGLAILQQVNYMVEHAMHDLQEGVWVYEGRNYRVGVVNNGHVGTSEVGEAIYNQGFDIAMMWREDGEGKMRFGLRSKVADVGAIASLWPGGGGHKASSGFEVSIEDGRKLIDWILERKDGTATHRS